MLISFLLAIICAYLFPDFVVKSKFLGKYFIKILKAFVPFLIFGTITYSIASFDAFSKIKKIVPLTLILYILSTLLAITFALIIGSGINYEVNNKPTLFTSEILIKYTGNNLNQDIIILIFPIIIFLFTYSFVLKKNYTQ